MSTTIVPEVYFFLSSIVYGVLLCVCYDQLRVLRALIKHSAAVTDAEDILFFLTAGLGFFGLLYIRNEGGMRWFAFFGCALGAVFYQKTFGPLLRAAELWLLRLLFYPLNAAFCWFLAVKKKHAALREKKRLQKKEKRIKIKEQRENERRVKEQDAGKRKEKRPKKRQEALGGREHGTKKEKEKKKKRA